ncbi:CHAT domain-containing protein [Amycolatopsis sp. Hca4]|uniref:CHAT domain-containing protein n=1 Tax=Amycolatopsis sp. Hca4 TaxID=2742131 RepID=UPI0020CB36F2|nr:CHAT domain-containing protein [Amycolatopsis sp. Hca4]
MFLDDGGDLVVLTIADGRARLVRAGRLAAAAELAARLRVDLDTLCGRRLPDRVAAVIAESARYHVEALSRELVAPLRPVLGDRDLVVVPTGQLAAVPWGLLPELRGRPVSVAPSATEWVRGRRRAKRAVSRGTVVVAGPDLRHADEEARHLARLLPGSVVLTGSDASVSRTLGALGAAGTAHLAAHGHHEPSNVLFSRLDLADGPLLAHDIQQLPAVPEHVVLSACDVGRAVVRAGDELLGFTAALLYSGTRSVIAGVARVPDEAVVPLMVRYHRIHSAGVPPARALAEAAGSEPFIPLVCFGSG